ncbi:MAG: DUF6134 family protein [Myxococcota bacterium]
MRAVLIVSAVASLLAAVFGITLSLAGTAQADPPSQPPNQEVRYRMFRNGSSIGTHETVFRSRGSRFAVQHEIRVQVSLGPIEAYRYEHTSTEYWSNQRLTQISSQTNKNGTALRLMARATGDAITIQGENSGRASLDAVPHTPHFNCLHSRPTRMIDAENGAVRRVRLSGPVDETLEIGDRSIATQRWRVTGDFDATLWYRDDGVMVKKLLIAPDDSTIITVLR